MKKTKHVGMCKLHSLKNANTMLSDTPQCDINQIPMNLHLQFLQQQGLLCISFISVSESFRNPFLSSFLFRHQRDYSLAWLFRINKSKIKIFVFRCHFRCNTFSWSFPSRKQYTNCQSLLLPSASCPESSLPGLDRIFHQLHFPRVSAIQTLTLLM